jgi:uncharacterized UPF0146 family protein
LIFSLQNLYLNKKLIYSFRFGEQIMQTILHL